MGVDIAHRRLRIVYWTPTPAPYMVERFNALAERDDVDLKVWFNAREVAVRDWAINESAWRFAFEYLKIWWFKGWGVGVPWALLIRRKPDVLILRHSDPVFVVGLILAKLRGIKTVFTMHGPPDGWGQPAEAKNKLKQFLFRIVDEVWCAGPQTVEYWSQFSNSPDKMKILRHPVNVDYFSAGSRLVTELREKERKLQGYKGTVFVYVGGLWRRKGVEYAIRAFNALPNAEEATLLIIGTGDLKLELEEEASCGRAADIKFLGFKQRWELPAILGLCDVFVFPSLGDVYGHVVEEAMACRLPIITSDIIGDLGQRLHAGTLGHGFAVKPRDVAGMEFVMRQFLGVEGRVLARTMGERALAHLDHRGQAGWAQDLCELLGRGRANKCNE